mgnify:CR=1 FL=1
MKINKLSSLLNGDTRSVKAKKNIIASGLFKGADLLIYLLLVPVTLGYLNPYEYGIWLTLNSILAWINSFDIGLGNGLRNKLAEAIAKDDKVLARKYVSTTFFMLVLLAVFFSVIGIVAVDLVNWNKLLNITPGTVNNLASIIKISFFFFCLNFVLKFVGNVYQALQLPSVMYVMNFAGHLLALIFIYILKFTVPGSLFGVALVYSAAPPLVYAITYPITFKRFFKYLSPSYLYFEKIYLKELFNLSILFFLIQMASLVLFSLSNLLISNMFGPAEVTPFNIVQRYFSVIPMITNIVIAPMWSATTDAFTKGDYEWIKATYVKLLKLLGVVFVVLALMVVLSPIVYRLWIGNKVEIPLVLSVLMAVYSFIIMWSHIYGYMLNGMGKLKLQTMNTIAVAIFYYPVCHTLGNRYYVAGIIIGMCVLNLSGLIINGIQFHLVTSRKATGIWNK